MNTLTICQLCREDIEEMEIHGSDDSDDYEWEDDRDYSFEDLDMP